MAELSTLARPYAKAAFASGQGAGNLANWSALLSFAAQIADDSEGRRALAHPTLTSEQKAAWLNDLAGERAFDAGSQFIQVLADNGRLDLLAEIHDQFEELHRQLDSSAVARVESAQALTDAQQATLSEALTRHLNKQVSLEVSVNADLVGGVVIRADDLVIDGSVSGKLAKLAEQLKP